MKRFLTVKPRASNTENGNDASVDNLAFQCEPSTSKSVSAKEEESRNTENGGCGNTGTEITQQTEKSSIKLKRKATIEIEKTKDQRKKNPKYEATTVIHHEYPIETCDSDSIDDDGDDDDDQICEEKKEKTRRKIYKQRFRENWKRKFPWLEEKSNRAFCKACLKSINGGKTHIERHAETNAHKTNLKSAQSTCEIQQYFNDDEKKNPKLVKAAEIKMTMFLHEHNLPFLLMDHLGKFLVSVCPDSEIAKAVRCARTKATSLTKDCIAAEQISTISEELRNGMFSIIIDETTDVSTEKSLAIVARFYDNQQRQCKDNFLGLIKVVSCTAEDLFTTICNHLKDLEVPITNMIGLAADNASVMMGSISGVQARFKQIIPNLFVLGCVCHSFHLCSSAAAHKLPRSLEEMIRSIYNYFSHSSNRVARLQEFQAFVQLKPHKLLRPSQTRWLSLQAAVDRVLENWDALILFFTNECFEDNLPSTQNILGQLKAPLYKVYFTFLSYALELVNKLNVEFQAEKPKLHLLLSRVRALYRSILRNYMEIKYLDSISLQKIDPSNPRNFLKLEHVYFGAQVDGLLSNGNIDPKEVHNFRTNCLGFYVVLAEQIKKRFNFNDEVLLFMSKFSPSIAVSGDIPNVATEAFKLFPQLVSDVEKLNSEWRLLADLSDLKAYKEEALEVFWSHIFEIKNDLKDFMFPHLTKLVKGLLCLPHSSAAAERVFSQLNLLKNKIRNRMHIDTCESILHAKELLNGKTCHDWQPSQKLLNRKPCYDPNTDKRK